MGKTKKNYVSSLREALASFDLKEYKRWVKKYNPNLYKTFCTYSNEVQMGTMCKMIISCLHRQVPCGWAPCNGQRGQP